MISACADDPGLREAVNLHKETVTNRAVAETFGMEYEELTFLNGMEGMSEMKWFAVSTKTSTVFWMSNAH